MQYSNPSSIYKETSINTSSPVKLVAMLYEGALRFVKQARECTLHKDMVGKSVAVDRAVAIIQHLQGTLDFDKGGDLTFNLDRLYTYINSRIFDGSVKLDLRAFDEAIRLLTTLHSAWEELSRKQQEDAIPAEFLAQQAGSESRFRLNA